MQCPSCGYSIDELNLDRCPRCGRPLTTTGDRQVTDSSPAVGPDRPPTVVKPVSPSAAATPQSPYPPYTPYGQYGAYPPSIPPYGQPASPSYPLAPSYPPPAGYFQTVYPQTAYPPPSYMPPPQRKNHTGLIIGIVALVVVVVAACTGGTIFAVRSLGQSGPLHDLSTIVTASPTPAPTATTIPVRTVVYQNTFASDADGWSIDTANCFWKSDGFHVTDGYECYAPTGVQTNVDVSVRAKQLSGDTRSPYGLVFGLDAKNSDYQFVVVGDSSWALFRCTNDGCTTAVDYTEDPAILGGLHTSNRLEVLVRGTHFEFYVNGNKVGSFDDPAYVSGRVGVAVGTSVESVFTDFVVSRP